MRALLNDIKFLLRPDIRLNQVKLFAREYGLSIIARKKFEKDPISQYGFELFKGRSGKRLRALVSLPVKGIKGPIRMYDFHYFGDLGTSTTTVFEYQSRSTSYPLFSIRPRGNSIFKSIFSDDDPVIATTTPEFREKYTIQTENVFELKENLTEEFLDRLGDEGEWMIEGNKQYIIYYQYRHLIPAERLASRMEQFAKLVYDLENGTPIFS